MHAIDLILNKLMDDVHYPHNLSTPFPYPGIFFIFVVTCSVEFFLSIREQSAYFASTSSFSFVGLSYILIWANPCQVTDHLWDTWCHLHHIIPQTTEIIVGLEEGILLTRSEKSISFFLLILSFSSLLYFADLISLSVTWDRNHLTLKICSSYRLT